MSTLLQGKKRVEAARKKTKGCALPGAIAFIAFCALMVGVVGPAIAPAALEIAAPLICPEDTVEAVVTRHVSYPEPGTTSVHGQLYCIDASGCATAPNEFFILLTLFGLAFGLFTAVLSVLSLTRWGARRALGAGGKGQSNL